MSETLLSSEQRTAEARRGGGSPVPDRARRRDTSAGASVEVAATEAMARQLRMASTRQRRGGGGGNGWRQQPWSGQFVRGPGGRSWGGEAGRGWGAKMPSRRDLSWASWQHQAAPMVVNTIHHVASRQTALPPYHFWYVHNGNPHYCTLMAFSFVPPNIGAVWCSNRE